MKCVRFKQVDVFTRAPFRGNLGGHAVTCVEGTLRVD